jgi:hypothetical protein
MPRPVRRRSKPQKFSQDFSEIVRICGMTVATCVADDNLQILKQLAAADEVIAKPSSEVKI